SAGALGYTRLARLFGSEVLASSYAALVLYAGVRVGEGLLAYVLRTRPLGSVLSVQRHRALVQRRLTLGLHALALVTWAYLTLDGLGVMGSLTTAGTAVLEARYTRGSVRRSRGATWQRSCSRWPWRSSSRPWRASFWRRTCTRACGCHWAQPTPSRRSCTTSSSWSDSSSRWRRSASTLPG